MAAEDGVGVVEVLERLTLLVALEAGQRISARKGVELPEAR